MTPAVGLRGRKGPGAPPTGSPCTRDPGPRARTASSCGPGVPGGRRAGAKDATRRRSGWWARGVGVAGLAPAATRSRTAQSSIEIHPGSDRRDSHPLETRFTASRLDDFGIDHGPPGRNRTSVARLSAECSAVELQAGQARRPPADRTEVRPAGGGWRVVGVVGIAPTASWSRTTRSGCWNYTPGIEQMAGFEPAATSLEGNNHLAAARGGPRARIVRWVFSCSTAELHLRGAPPRRRVVGVAGIAPTASRSPTVRSHY